MRIWVKRVILATQEDLAVSVVREDSQLVAAYPCFAGSKQSATSKEFGDDGLR
jgi:hypothetical protein